MIAKAVGLKPTGIELRPPNGACHIDRFWKDYEKIPAYIVVHLAAPFGDDAPRYLGALDDGDVATLAVLGGLSKGDLRKLKRITHDFLDSPAIQKEVDELTFSLARHFAENGPGFYPLVA